MAVVLGLIIWGATEYFHLGASVPAASTNLTANLSGDAWAQGRRTAQNTAFTPDTAPVPRSVKWTFATNKPLGSSPAIVGDRVYLSTGDGRTVALERESGQLVWEFRTGLVSRSTPVVAGGLVIAAYSPGLIVALDRNTGLTRWEVNLNQPISSSPVVGNGTLYFGAGDWMLHALDVATGAERWAFLTRDWIVSPVAYAGGTVVVASQDSRVNLVDAKSGRQRLMYNTGFQRFGGGPTIEGDTVYVSSDRGWVSAIDRLAKTYPGQRAWWRVKINLYVWKVISTLPVQPGTLWSRRVGGQIKGLLAVAHDTVYGATEQGQVFAQDADTGEKKWSTTLNVGISTGPSVAGNTVLVGTQEGRVFGLDAASGDVLWQYRAGNEKIVGSPVVAGDTMYVASADGTLYAITGGN
ncbi:MAG: PQQ-binding-like beta-propeller repeat protein [Chloroflexi bacterium]|nr:PQQ-binding-like beta-propeller repeat protein [Chloroflexota bacterium]